jgi:hypothetical protein
MKTKYFNRIQVRLTLHLVTITVSGLCWNQAGISQVYDEFLLNPIPADVSLSSSSYRPGLVFNEDSIPAACRLGGMTLKLCLNV